MRVLKNGALGAWFNTVTKDGKHAQVFRIYKSSPEAMQVAINARKHPRPITQAQAQKAFDSFYARTRTIKRGPRKGQPMFKSPAGRKRARTYDLTHTSKKVISDARYLHNPHAYDFQGVDTGSKPRKVPTQKQLDNLAEGRKKHLENLAARKNAKVLGSNVLGQQTQAGGYWW
jgi:hypothetical protein